MASPAVPDPDPDPTDRNPWTADEPDAAPTTPLLDDPQAAPSPPAPLPHASDNPLPTSPPPPLSALVDAALHFLSTATPAGLAACLALLAAATYAVLGRVGLLLIGAAGGVVLHATWDGGASSSLAQAGEGGGAAAERWRRDVGVEVARRALEWRDGEREKGGEVGKVEIVDGRALGYAEFPPQTAAALGELTDAVVRDYVKYDRSWVDERC
jgi:hypothetical protein